MYKRRITYGERNKIERNSVEGGALEHLNHTMLGQKLSQKYVGKLSQTLIPEPNQNRTRLWPISKASERTPLDDSGFS